MEKIRLFAVGLFLMAVLAVSSFAQATAAQGKIGVINSYEFGDEKAGITKYVNAINALNAEFKTVEDELRAMNTKFEALKAEIANIQKLAASNPKAVDEKSAQAKVEEVEKLQREYKFKSEDAKLRYDKRQQAVLGPVLNDIYKAIQEYSKQKGYMMILDVSKMDETNVIIALDEKALITKDFITFYNARPATTASATTPK